VHGQASKPPGLQVGMDILSSFQMLLRKEHQAGKG